MLIPEKTYIMIPEKTLKIVDSITLDKTSNNEIFLRDIGDNII